MIAASPVPTIIAATVSRARRRIAGHFHAHRAICAEDAVAYVPQSRIEHGQFERMRTRGVIREAGSGRYWIDTAAWNADNEARRRRLVPIVIVLALLAAAVPLFFY